MGRISGSFGNTAEPQVGERQTELTDWRCQSNSCRALAISSLAVGFVLGLAGVHKWRGDDSYFAVQTERIRNSRSLNK